jgi:hypothetical protein
MDKTNTFRKGLWIRLLVLGILLSPVALFLLVSVTINLQSVPSEMREAPDEVVQAFRIHSAPNPASVRSAPLSPSRETRPRGLTYDDYAKWLLEREPDNKSAALYLEMAERHTSEERRDLSHQLSSDDRWRMCLAEGQPLPAEIRALLEDNADHIETILRLAEAGTIPNYSRAEIEEMDGMELAGMPVPNFLTFMVACKFMSSDALRCLMNGRDQDCAERLAAIYDLAKMTAQGGYDICWLIALASANTGSMALREWMQNREIALEILPDVLSALDDAADSIGTVDGLLLGIECNYRIQRYFLVQSLEKPWMKSIDTGYILAATRDEILPKLAKFPGELYYAAKRKTNSEELLRRIDACWEKAAISAIGPYEGLQERDQELYREMDRIGDDYGARSWLNGSFTLVTRGLVCRARINLLRAAMRSKLGRQDFAELPDPFTEEPLNAEEGPNHLLLWSLGPDLTDQQGKIEYDPTNGTASGGDLTIRIQTNLYGAENRSKELRN